MACLPRGLTADYPAVGDQVRADLIACRYEDAAQRLLDRMGPNVFAEAVQNAFGTRIKTLEGPVQLLPFVFKRGCLTTNFDYVLNRVYDASECRLIPKLSKRDSEGGFPNRRVSDSRWRVQEAFAMPIPLPG